MTCYIIVTLCFHIYRESDSRNGVIQVLPLVSNLLKVIPFNTRPTVWRLYTGREETRRTFLCSPYLILKHANLLH